MGVARKSAVAGHLGMLLVCLNFGGLNVLLQWALGPDTGAVGPRIARSAVFTLYRDVGASALLALASACSGRLRPAWGRLRRDACAVGVAGICGIGSGLFFTVGLALTNADCAGLLQPAVPVLTVGLGLVLGLEQRSWGKLAAVALSVAGALVAVDWDDLSASSAAGWAALLCNALALATWLLQQRRLLDAGHDALALTAAMYAAGAAAVLAACALGFALRPALLAAPGVLGLGPRAGLALAYATVLSSALNYALITWASARLEPSTVSLWASGQGVVTLALAYAALGAAPSAAQLGGGALIVSGLVVCVAVTVEQQRAEARGALLRQDAQSGRSDAELPSPSPSPPYVRMAAPTPS
jgi:drug/metabolite transporter (DMT)-like permease